MSDNMKKDVLIQLKSFEVGQSNAGSFLASAPKVRTQYRLTTEQAAIVAQEITAQLKTEDGQTNGIKLDIHTGERETKDGNRTFSAGFMFVKALQAAPGKGKAQGGTVKFVPKTAS